MKVHLASEVIFERPPGYTVCDYDGTFPKSVFRTTLFIDDTTCLYCLRAAVTYLNVFRKTQIQEIDNNVQT